MIRICQPLTPNYYVLREHMEESHASGQLSNFGPAYDKLIEELKDFLNLAPDKDIVLTSSGHTALMAAYYALGCRYLIGPDYTFPSTMSAATIQRIIYEHTDVCKATAAPDPDVLNEYLTWSKAIDSVVITAPLSNIPDFKSLYDVCVNHNRLLIIDGAATFGTPDIYNYCDAFCYSFHATKTLSIGEGGALICSKAAAKIARRFINFNKDADFGQLKIGINGKLSEYACAIGLSILPAFRADMRLRNAAIYRKYLDRFCLETYSDQTVYQVFPLFFDTPYEAEQVRLSLAREGVETLQYYKPLKSLFISSDLYNRNVCIPVHQGVTEQQAEDIAKLIVESL